MSALPGMLCAFWWACLSLVSGLVSHLVPSGLGCRVRALGLSPQFHVRICATVWGLRWCNLRKTFIKRKSWIRNGRVLLEKILVDTESHRRVQEGKKRAKSYESWRMESTRKSPIKRKSLIKKGRVYIRICTYK